MILALVGTLGILNWEPDLGSSSIPHAKRRHSLVRQRKLPDRIIGAEAEHVKSVLSVIQSNINPDTFLAYSFTGDKRLEYWSVVYDNCIRSLAHLRTGRVDLAKKPIDYFIENTAIQKIGYVQRKGKIVRSPGWIVNIVDASESRPGGRGIEHIAHAGPNIYLGITSVHLYRATGEEKYLKFARKQWTLVKDLQNENPKDRNFGGVRMGPMGSPDNPREQKLNFKIYNPSFYQFYNGEHAADFKAFSDLMALVDPKNSLRYEHASALVSKWDKSIYDVKKHLFFIGTTEKRYFDANIGKWIDPGIIPMYPLDTSSLKISAYGVEGLEQFEPQAAEKIRSAIEENFKVTVEIPGEDGKKIKVSGYDFVCNDDRKKLVRFIELGNYGDKKVAQGKGRRPLLTDEWSNWVALADLRLADDFKKMGQNAKATTYFNSYYDNAITNGLRTAVKTKEGLAYPYCHPLPDSLNQPVGFGWNTHHVPYAVIGGSARILGLLRFDPFRLNGGDHALTMKVEIKELGPSLGVSRDRSVLYTEAELYLRDAWKDVTIAQINGPNAEKYWRRAMASVEKMLREHQDWIEAAKVQNKILGKSKDPFPLSGVANLTERDLEHVYRKYWALYHVGTAQFILVMGNANLRDIAKEKGQYDKEKAFDLMAIEAAKRVQEDFTYAQTYDQNGWLWQPSQALFQYVDVPAG